MKALTYHDRRGPAVVFLPPAEGEIPQSAAAPGVNEMNSPAYAQVAARGAKASWKEHCKNLVNSAPYAGRWTEEDVPDGYTPRQALRHIRGEHAMAPFTKEAGAEEGS